VITYELYEKAYINTLKAYQENLSDITETVKKAVFYGVKMVNTKELDDVIIREEAEYDFAFANLVISMMATLTPKEFMNIFPIEKEYDGHKWGMKDYFYTMEYIKTLDLDKPIGEKIFDFLWEYMNEDITRFMIKLLQFTSRLRQLEGKPTLVEEFADMMGIKTYKLFRDEKGREFLLDSETGKTMRVKPKRRLKLIK
jgi:hypothetical protein